MDIFLDWGETGKKSNASLTKGHTSKFRPAKVLFFNAFYFEKLEKCEWFNITQCFILVCQIQFKQNN